MSMKFEPSYLSFLDEVYHCHWSTRKKQKIARLKRAVEHFWPDGHPSRLLHISGTNGKGSVAYYLEQGFTEWGKTGSWTGPHVFDYAERFHICGKQVSHEEIIQIYRQEIEPYQMSLVDHHGQEPLGFASIGILIALKLFERHDVKWGIMEVGAGGRYTPLMALHVDGCILTNIGEDHPLTLGKEVWQRALEKAGMVRQGKPFFSSEMGQARTYVQQTVQDGGGLLFELSKEQCKRVQGILNDEVPEFRLRNLGLAVDVVSYFYPETSVPQLLDKMNAHLPGRFWEFEEKRIITDVAHNRNKIAALAEHLRLKYPGRKMIFLLGLTRQRDPIEVFEPIFPLTASMVVTSASYAGQDPVLLARKLKGFVSPIHVISDPEKAFHEAKSQMGEEDILVLTGSAYMIDQALNQNRYLAHMNASYGWRGNSLT